MFCGWEGNRGLAGVALAMHHRLKWFIYLRYRLKTFAREMSQHSFGYGRPTLYLFTWWNGRELQHLGVVSKVRMPMCAVTQRFTDYDTRNTRHWLND